MDEDKACSEAIFHYPVTNFSKLGEWHRSPSFYVRNLTWKIVVGPRINLVRDELPKKSLAFFLECNGGSNKSSWSCYAKAELRLIAQDENKENLSRKIQHLFNSEKNDSGFSNFTSWDFILAPDNGYIKDDSIFFEVHVVADVPHGVSWYSKKHTGYVGLDPKTPSYFNSLLQTLYFTNQLRKAVYKTPIETAHGKYDVVLALQRLFHGLQTSDKRLIMSFGSEDFTNLDIWVFLKALISKLDSRMKGTSVEGTIPKLFEGKMLNVLERGNYKSSLKQSFYHIQLNVKGKKNITECFEDCIKRSKDVSGDQESERAEKGVVFVSFPAVLHLYLERFSQDQVTQRHIKINDRFEFQEKLNLDPYLEAAEDTPAHYTLHSVLVHRGESREGDYVVFIDPKGDGKWCKFDDDVVSRCSKHEAIKQNYGGNDNETVKPFTSAYMLVYIRDSELHNVLQDVTEQDIPEAIRIKIHSTKKEASDETILKLFESIMVLGKKSQEVTELEEYMTVQVVLEDSFCGHQGNDLYDPERAVYKVFRVKKSSTLHELMETFADTFKCPAEHLRLWPFGLRSNQTCRPNSLDPGADLYTNIEDISDSQNPWNVFLECVLPDSGLTSLPVYDIDTVFLLFFKLYDPQTKRIYYCGHHFMPKDSKVQELLPMLNERAGFPPDTELMLYEEIKPNLVERITSLTESIEKVMEEISDGDIIVFQKKPEEKIAQPAGIGELKMPTCRDYFRYIFYRVEVTICNVATVDDPGFTIELSTRMNYHQLKNAVAQRLQIDAYRLQFYNTQGLHANPGILLNNWYEGTLRDILYNKENKDNKKIYYEVISIPQSITHDLDEMKFCGTSVYFKRSFKSTDNRQ